MQLERVSVGGKPGSTAARPGCWALCRHDQGLSICVSPMPRRLLVEEDDRELTMAFQLDPDGGTGGIMRRFHGRWQIRPHPADPEHACMSTLDQARQLGYLLIMRHTHWLRGPGHSAALLHGAAAAAPRCSPLREFAACLLFQCDMPAALFPAACCRTLRWASPCPRPLTASSSASRATRCGLGA